MSRLTAGTRWSFRAVAAGTRWLSRRVATRPGPESWVSGVRARVRPPYQPRVHPAVIVTPLAAALALWRLGTPALWIDEATTWSAAERPLNELLLLAGERDRALFPYYAFMHLWARGGVSEMWLRLPSALAAAAAAGFTAAIGARLWSPRAGLIAGLLLILLPDWSRYAQEARPYAFALAFSAAATWALVRAIDEDDWWPAYTVAIVGAVAAHFVTLLILVVHAISVVRRGTGHYAGPPGAGPAHRAHQLRGTQLRWWAESATFAVLPGIGLVIWSVSQPTQQLSWTRPDLADLGSLWEQLVGSWEVSLLLAALVAVAWWRRLAPTLLLGWLLLPPLVLFVAAQLTPLWAARYLMFVLPAGVLIAAILLASVRPWVPVLAIAGTLWLAAPGIAATRAPDGHGQDYRLAAQVIARDATAGTAVLLSPSWQRSGLAYYLRGPAVDVMVSGPRPADALHAPEAGASTAAARLARFNRVWWVRLGPRPRPLEARDRIKKQVLDRWFRPVRSVRPRGLILTLYER
jgi:mannosyltransferase